MIKSTDKPVYVTFGIFTWRTKRTVYPLEMDLGYPVEFHKYSPLHLSLLQMHASFASIVSKKKKKKKSGIELLTFHHGTFMRPIKPAAPFDS